MLFRRRNRNPLAFLSALIWPQKGFYRGWLYLMMRILRLRSSDYSLAAGLSSGVAVSFTPFIGLHFLLAIVLAWLIRGNMIIAMIGTAIGNPWSFPLIWALIYSVGTSLLGKSPIEADISMISLDLFLEQPGQVLVSMLVGGGVIGIGAWIITFGLSYVFAGKLKNWLKKLRADRKRVLASKRIAQRQAMEQGLDD